MGNKSQLQHGKQIILDSMTHSSTTNTTFAMATLSTQHRKRQHIPRSAATFTSASTRSRSTSRSMRARSIHVLLVLAAIATVAAASGDQDSARRAAAKPWAMKEIKLVEFPDAIYSQLVNLAESLGLEASSAPRRVCVSPFTAFLVMVIAANVWAWLSYHLSGTWVEASHILVKDTGPKTLKALKGLRDQLGKDAKLFGQTAKEYSQCPSSHQNGDLGRFGRGVMAPPFDKLCFDPSTPIGETIGPVQTQFGYHLIYLRERKY